MEQLYIVGRMKVKRSEVLKLIANQLDFLKGSFEGFKTNFSDKELKEADVILTSLEEAGIKPPDVLRPATKYEIQQGYSFVDQYSQEDVVWDQVWEPEDITCSRCGTVNDTRIKMGGLVCNNCNMVVVYPGTEEYNQRLEAERRSESFLITDTATMEDPLIEVASPETSVEVTTSEAPAEERDNETLVEVTRMWRPN